MNKNRPYKVIAPLNAIAALGVFAAGILNSNSTHFGLGAFFSGICAIGLIAAHQKDDGTR